MKGSEKSDIAVLYVEDALQLYRSGRYFSALTLSGAAEEILGAIVTRLGSTNKNALDGEIELRLEFDATMERISGGKLPARTDQSIKRALVYPRNAAKHFNTSSESRCEFNPQLECALLLTRALLNFKLVFPQNARDFEDSQEMLGIDILNINMRGLNSDA